MTNSMFYCSKCGKQTSHAYTKTYCSAECHYKAHTTPLDTGCIVAHKSLRCEKTKKTVKPDNPNIKRIVWNMFKNSPAKDELVIGLCSNPCCVNVDHMGLSTRGEVMAQAQKVRVKNLREKNKITIKNQDITKESLITFENLLKEMATQYTHADGSVIYIYQPKKGSQ